MNFSADTISILKNFSSINKSLMFKKGSVLSSVAPNKNILAVANIKEEFETDFAIFELSKFLGVLSLFDTPNVDIKEKYATISEKGKKIRYSFAAPHLIMQAPTIKELPPVFVEFPLETSVINTLMKTASVMGLDQFSFRGNGEKLTIAISDSKKTTDDEFTIDVGETDKDFVVSFMVEDFKLLEQNYTVLLSENGLIQFKNDILHYFVMGKTGG